MIAQAVLFGEFFESISVGVGAICTGIAAIFMVGKSGGKKRPPRDPTEKKSSKKQSPDKEI